MSKGGREWFPIVAKILVPFFIRCPRSVTPRKIGNFPPQNTGFYLFTRPLAMLNWEMRTHDHPFKFLETKVSRIWIQCTITSIVTRFKKEFPSGKCEALRFPKGDGRMTSKSPIPGNLIKVRKHAFPNAKERDWVF